MPTLLERGNAVITTPPKDYDVVLQGWEAIADRVSCQEGVVVVVPDEFPKRFGVIELPSEVQEHVNADIGTVIGSGVDGYEPGDRVLYLSWAGNWFTPWKVGPYQVHEARFYGLISPTVEDLAIHEEVSNVLPAKYVGTEIKPVGDWVLIKRDPLVKEHGEFKLYLCDDAKYRTWKATVVATGPKANVDEGARVMYHGPSLVVGLKEMRSKFGWSDEIEDYALIRSKNLYCTLDEE